MLGDKLLDSLILCYEYLLFIYVVYYFYSSLGFTINRTKHWRMPELWMEASGMP